MNAKPIKFGIIGLGNIADHHIQSVLESDLCELVAVCSRSEAKLADAKSMYEVNTFTDYHEIDGETGRRSLSKRLWAQN